MKTKENKIEKKNYTDAIEVLMVEEGIDIEKKCNFETLINEPTYDLFEYIRENLNKEQIFNLDLNTLSFISTASKFRYRLYTNLIISKANAKTVGQLFYYLFNKDTDFNTLDNGNINFIINLFLKLGLNDDMIHVLKCKISNSSDNINSIYTLTLFINLISRANRLEDYNL